MMKIDAKSVYFFVVARYDEEVCTKSSVDKLVLHHKQLFVDSWCTSTARTLFCSSE
jgi:hypothetical protein